MDVLFISTGGTIDKDYAAGAGVYDVEIGKPAIERIMEKIHPSFDYRVLPLLRKDSQDITDEDRELLVETCESEPERHIVVTHGTDTMTKTGKALTLVRNKVIVLTGSSRPERFVSSDADFNVGAAVGALSVVRAGVYVAMHGRVLPWNRIHKDPATGQFVET